MVEHRPLSDFIAYAILTLGVFIVAFPDIQESKPIVRIQLILHFVNGNFLDLLFRLTE